MDMMRRKVQLKNEIWLVCSEETTLSITLTPINVEETAINVTESTQKEMKGKR